MATKKISKILNKITQRVKLKVCRPNVSFQAILYDPSELQKCIDVLKQAYATCGHKVDYFTLKMMSSYHELNAIDQIISTWKVQKGKPSHLDGKYAAGRYGFLQMTQWFLMGLLGAWGKKGPHWQWFLSTSQRCLIPMSISYEFWFRLSATHMWAATGLVAVMVWHLLSAWMLELSRGTHFPILIFFYQIYITLHLDYCNSLYLGLDQSNLQHLHPKCCSPSADKNKVWIYYLLIFAPFIGSLLTLWWSLRVYWMSSPSVC